MALRDDVIPRGPDDTAIMVWLDPETKQALRVIAAEHGLAMASFVRRMIQDRVAERPAGKIPKKSPSQA